MTRDLKILSLSLLVWGFGEGLFIFFQPLLLRQIGADPILIGTILGASAFATGIAQIPFGWISDHVGARPLLWGSWILGTMATIIIAASSSVIGFTIGLVLYGFSGSIMAPLNSYFSTIRGKLSLSRVIAFATSAYNIGAIAGPILGGFIAEKTGLKTVYIFSCFVFFLSTAIVFFVKDHHSKSTETEHPSHKTAHYSRPFISFIVITFLILFSTNLPLPLASNYLYTMKGLNYAQVGLLGTMISVGYVVFVTFISKREPKLGLLLPLLGMFVFSLVVWRSGSFIFFIGVYLFGCGPRLVRSMSAAYARPLLHEARVGTGYGLLETSNSFALMLSPVAAGWLIQRDPELIYPIAMGLLIIILIIAWVSFKKIEQK